jgi:hypothetical protein
MSFNEIIFDKKENKNNNLVTKQIHNFNMTLDLESEGISKVLYHVGIRE